MKNSQQPEQSTPLTPEELEQLAGGIERAICARECEPYPQPIINGKVAYQPPTTVGLIAQSDVNAVLS